MQKALGITALVVSIIAIFTPVLGPWMTVVVAIMAVFSEGDGYTLGLSAIIINIVNLLILSPQFLGLLSGASGADGVVIALVMMASQVVALFFLVKRNKKYKLRSEESAA